jgi:Zn-dependent peptidase ImmA (M78 family)
MQSMFTNAVAQADQVRIRLGFDMFQPINIFDVCRRLDIDVRFLDVNMEGMYFSLKDRPVPTIIVSALRPLPRRAFTCAHELGHHVFNHGTRVDALSEDNPYKSSNPIEELLVDAFAGNLLMPNPGIAAEIAARNWNAKTLTPLQVQTLASVFGTGYNTFIVHCRVNKVITVTQEKALLKSSPAKILRTLIDTAAPPTHFKIVDGKSEMPVIDLEVSNYIFLPPKTRVIGNHLQFQTGLNNPYKAVTPGIVQVTTADNTFSSFVRIQRTGYIGLSEYRHLENAKD